MIWIFAFVVAWVPETVKVRKKLIVEFSTETKQRFYFTYNHKTFFLSISLPQLSHSPPPPPPFPASPFYVSPSSLLPSLDRQLDFVHRASPRSREYKIKTIFDFFLVKKTHKKVPHVTKKKKPPHKKPIVFIVSLSFFCSLLFTSAVSLCLLHQVRVLF